MKKNNLTLKETFKIALENYRKKNYSMTEKLCNKTQNQVLFSIVIELSS